MSNAVDTKVWDLPVRLFHWTLAGCFFIAYISEDELMSLHTLAGYTIGGLILFRLIWGFIGPRHARFSNFVYAPTTVLAYIKSVVSFNAKRYEGHNPAGGAMVLALLLSLAFTVITGLMAYGGEEHAGPLAVWMASQPHWFAEAAEEVHEFFANFTLLLVLFHVAGVLVASLQHGENLIRAMVTGRKRSTQA